MGEKEKTLEGERTLFRRGFSLPPNLPHFPRTSPKTPPLIKRRFVSLSESGGVLGEVFYVSGGSDWFTDCGYRAVGVGGVFLVVIRYVGAEIPPAGAPSGFDSAAGRAVLRSLFHPPCRSAQDDTVGKVFCEM